MSIGSIKDPRVEVKPSAKLIHFICTLSGESEMPENVLKIYQIHNDENETNKRTTDKTFAQIPFTSAELNILKELNSDSTKPDIKSHLDKLLLSCESSEEEENDEIENLDSSSSKKSKTQAKRLKELQKQKLKSSLRLNLNDLKWLNLILAERRKENEKFDLYLHQLLEGSQICLPKNEILIRNPELEARCVKLRFQQEARTYEAMTKNVDSSRQKMPEDTLAYQMKSINRQLIAVLQFVFSVAAGFAFGFIGVELIVGNLDFGFRLLLGIICSLVIALAEIYFLAKRLNEEYDMETAKPKLVEDLKVGNGTPKRTVIHTVKLKDVDGNKEHVE